MPRNIAISIAPPPPPPFTPVTLTINSRVELANIVGALSAYGRGEVYAENGLKKIGLGAYYSGNVRKAAREIVLALSKAAGFVPPADFTDYLGSSKFKSSHPSTAGSAVRGGEEDLAVGRSATSFESPFNVDADDEVDVDGDEDEDGDEDQPSF